MCLLLIIPSLALMMLIVMGYALLSVYVFRLRAQSVMPINSLLFDQCDPLACASAILCFSRRGKTAESEDAPAVCPVHAVSG